MKQLKRGRHAPAFVLLFLAEEPAYGLEICGRINAAIPENRIDTAAVYRALKELESEGMVESNWKTSDPGPAKKYYTITDLGLHKLAEFNEEIRKRIRNLTRFTEAYAALNLEGELLE